MLVATLAAAALYVASLLGGVARLMFTVICVVLGVQAALVMIVGGALRRLKRERAMQRIGEAGGRITARLASHPDRIVEISFAGAAVNADALEPLTAIPELERLDLSGTRVGDDALEPLASLRNLSEVDLDGTAVTDRCLAVLESLPRLRRLQVARTAVTADAVAWLLEVRPDLRVERSPGDH